MDAFFPAAADMTVINTMCVGYLVAGFGYSCAVWLLGYGVSVVVKSLERGF